MMKVTGTQHWVRGQQCFALFCAAMALPGYGQAGAQAGSGLQVMESSAAPAQSEVLREIDDPSTGDRWLLMRDGKNPGGPGRLVRMAAHPGEPGRASWHSEPQIDAARLLPVIHAGEHLVVEEHTAVADAYLEAQAMNPAAPGATFAARLAIGGRVVRAIALGPGRAALQPEAEVRP
jgi:hypothetical protein